MAADAVDDRDRVADQVGHPLSLETFEQHVAVEVLIGAAKVDRDVVEVGDLEVSLDPAGGLVRAHLGVRLLVRRDDRRHRVDGEDVRRVVAELLDPQRAGEALAVDLATADHDREIGGDSARVDDDAALSVRPQVRAGEGELMPAPPFAGVEVDLTADDRLAALDHRPDGNKRPGGCGRRGHAAKWQQGTGGSGHDAAGRSAVADEGGRSGLCNDKGGPSRQRDQRADPGDPSHDARRSHPRSP